MAHLYFHDNRKIVVFDKMNDIFKIDKIRYFCIISFIHDNRSKD